MSRMNYTILYAGHDVGKYNWASPPSLTLRPTDRPIGYYALLFHRHLSTFHGTQYGPNGTREAGLLQRREGASRH